MNLLGGWIFIGIIIMALPEVRSSALSNGEQLVAVGVGRESFASAVLAGVVITLMTWMEQSTRSMPARLLAVIVTAFLLMAPPLHHVIIAAVEMFAALHVGAGFGYGTWAAITAWSLVGNMAGGILLVTALRMIQAGKNGANSNR